VKVEFLVSLTDLKRACRRLLSRCQGSLRLGVRALLSHVFPARVEAGRNEDFVTSHLLPKT
jgi:hypothetical protein